MRWQDIDCISEAAGLDYDLEAKYDHYNRLLFDGELPKIPITWANTKTAGGKVTFKVLIDPARRPSPLMIRLGKASKYDGAMVVPGSMKIQVSSLFKRSEVGLDKILIHEMIHVYFASKGDVAEQHGPKFVAMAKRISEQVGFDVPLRDELQGLELADSRPKPIGIVLLTKNDGNYQFAMLSPSNLDQLLPELKQRWTRFVDHGYVKSAEFHRVSSRGWTLMANRLPVQRPSSRKLGNMKFFALRDKELLDELRRAGIRLGDVSRTT